MRTVDEKFTTVIAKNTFYFINPIFQQNYETHINSLKESLLTLKNEIQVNGLRKEIFERLLERANGLRALLALTGLSNEYLKRLITIIRIVDDPELVRIVYKDRWCGMVTPGAITEWGDAKIESLIRTNVHFRKAIVNIFFEGATIPYIANTIPLFELKKLSITKLNFDVDAMIDTVVRYKEKGSYSGKAENNAEALIAELLASINVSFEKGDLGELIDNAPDNKRTMDFIIPNKRNPVIIAECSYLSTTSSGQGDKSKTELSIDVLLKRHYPRASFIGFIDGIGWYVRKGDLRRMVTAYEDVFTFHLDELTRFREFVLEKTRG